MNEGQRFEKRSLDRTFLFLLIVFVVFVHVLHEIGNLEQFRVVTLDWYASFWDWYRHLAIAHPVETLFVTIQIIAGTVIYFTLRGSVPTWWQAMPAGLSLRNYFWVQTFFWLAVIVELPIAVALIIHDVPVWVHILPHAALLVLIASLYAGLADSTTLNHERFRRFFTPILTLVAPGIGMIYRLQSLKFLPPELSRVIDWIVEVYPRLLLTPL